MPTIPRFMWTIMSALCNVMAFVTSSSVHTMDPFFGLSENATQLVVGIAGVIFGLMGLTFTIVALYAKDEVEDPQPKPTRIIRSMLILVSNEGNEMVSDILLAELEMTVREAQLWADAWNNENASETSYWWCRAVHPSYPLHKFEP